MNNIFKSPSDNALILFSDVVDSSMYSAILGIEEYAKALLAYQKLFKRLAEIYFVQEHAYKDAYIKINVSGDEGIIFCVAPNLAPAEIIYHAVQFSFELKALMELIMRQKDETKRAPRRMTIGTGIHFGEVAIVRKDNTIGVPKDKDDIQQIEGFNINYAKRVEATSRIGKYSRVFLSKIAQAYISNLPVIMEKYEVDLKGISKVEDVFEISSAYFKKMPLDYGTLDQEEFLETYASNPLQIDYVQEPWLKSFVISVLDTITQAEHDQFISKRYMRKKLDLAWCNPTENDPILLFMRAIDCKHERKHTRRISILKDIINRFPGFLYARKELIRAFNEVVDSPSLPGELVYVRDNAQEYLDKYKHFLKESEIKDFQLILQKLGPKLTKISES